jgi:hypothetical protein
MLSAGVAFSQQFLAILVSGRRHLEPSDQKGKPAGCGERQRIKRPAIAGLRAATKKAAAVDAAAFREIVDRWRVR